MWHLSGSTLMTIGAHCSTAQKLSLGVTHRQNRTPPIHGISFNFRKDH